MDIHAEPIQVPVSKDINCKALENWHEAEMAMPSLYDSLENQIAKLDNAKNDVWLAEARVKHAQDRVNSGNDHRDAAWFQVIENLAAPFCRANSAVTRAVIDARREGQAPFIGD